MNDFDYRFENINPKEYMDLCESIKMVDKLGLTNYLKHILVVIYHLLISVNEEEVISDTQELKNYLYFDLQDTPWDTNGFRGLSVDILNHFFYPFTRMKDATKLMPVFARIVEDVEKFVAEDNPIIREIDIRQYAAKIAEEMGCTQDEIELLVGSINVMLASEENENG